VRGPQGRDAGEGERGMRRVKTEVKAHGYTVGVSGRGL